MKRSLNALNDATKTGDLVRISDEKIPVSGLNSVDKVSSPFAVKNALILANNNSMSFFNC